MMALAHVIASALVAALAYFGIRYFVRTSERFGSARETIVLIRASTSIRTW
jgi:hypothetical protein